MTINIELSAQSITNAIKEVKAYKKELAVKVKSLIDVMTAFGESYAVSTVGHIDTGKTQNSIHGYRHGDVGYIVAGGAAVWLEFGTGVKYNGPVGSSPHPKGEELGMTIGTYGKGHGADPNGWYYPADEGKWKHTYGIEANQFMYQTAQELKRVFPELARKVFE